MLKVSKKIKIYITIVFICILFCGVFFLSTSLNFFDSKIELGSVYDYTEQSILVSEFSQEDQKVINEYLERCYIKDDKSEGFGLIHRPDPNMFEKLYFNYVLYKRVNGGNLSDEYLTDFKNVFYKYEMALGNYGITAYDYFYYICIKCELGEDYNQELLLNTLQQYQNKDTNLIFYRTETEGLNTEMLITGKIIRLARVYGINLAPLNFEESIKKQLKEYNFKSHDTKGAMYELGGAIIFAAKEYPSLKNDIKSKYDWYKAWKDKYEEFRINNMTSLVEYSSFLTIAQQFEETSDSKIKEYVLTLKDIEVEGDESELIDDERLYDYVFYEYNQVVSKQYKEKVFDGLIENIKSYKHLHLDSQNINIGDTYYGLRLAEWSKFHFDGKRILQTVDTIYQEISENCSDREYVYNTYYYIMIKSSFNNGILEKNEANSISKYVDRILGRMLEKTEELDISCLRVALEIKSNLRSYILKSHKEKIRSLVESYIESPVNNNRAIEYIKIDKILTLNLMDRLDFQALKDTLSDQGGFKCTREENPDLKTTFLFYSLISNHDIFYPSVKEKEELLSFLNKLESQDGLYRYELNYSKKDIRSIYYGYTLKNGAGVISDKSLPIKKN